MVNTTSRMIYDAEKISVNTAWMKRFGNHFEVVVEPDKALEYRRTKGASPELRECLHAERVFTDAKRGLQAKETDLEQAFGTTAALEIARKLIIEGELQLTAEHRAKIREAKRNQILSKIVTYAIDPTTGIPHPQRRIELAMDEAKVKIDDNRDVDEQIREIIRKLQPIIPIRLETVTLQVHLPAQYSQKLYGEMQRFGTIRKGDWMNDGSWMGWVDLPAGLQADLINELGKRTHGAADVKKVGEHEYKGE
jgi:ribosome maturation protein SDO1